MSKALTGRTFSEESKRKMSENHADIRGENHPRASLTYEQVWEIHTLYATGNFTQKQLGKSFHVSRQHICRIVRGESWEHIYDKFQSRCTRC